MANLSAGAKVGDTLTLRYSGANGTKVILGDTTVDANGAVITLVEGQTQARFALVLDGDLGADTQGSLSVTYSGDGQSAGSNIWVLNMTAAAEADATLTGGVAVGLQKLTRLCEQQSQGRARRYRGCVRPTARLGTRITNVTQSSIQA